MSDSDLVFSVAVLVGGLPVEVKHQVHAVGSFKFNVFLATVEVGHTSFTVGGKSLDELSNYLDQRAQGHLAGIRHMVAATYQFMGAEDRKVFAAQMLEFQDQLEEFLAVVGKRRALEALVEGALNAQAAVVSNAE